MSLCRSVTVGDSAGTSLQPGRRSGLCRFADQTYSVSATLQYRHRWCSVPTSLVFISDIVGVHFRHRWCFLPDIVGVSYPTSLVFLTRHRWCSSYPTSLVTLIPDIVGVLTSPTSLVCPVPVIVGVYPYPSVLVCVPVPVSVGVYPYPTRYTRYPPTQVPHPPCSMPRPAVPHVTAVQSAAWRCSPGYLFKIGQSTRRC